MRIKLRGVIFIKMEFKGTEIVEKSNALNEIHLNGMGLQELRFFSIYLAKINARDINTRKVRFKLTEFQKIMKIGRANIKHFQEITNAMLGRVYNQPTDDGGYIGFTLFKRCRIFKNIFDNQYYIEIEASDDALPLMFNLRSRYFKYELWNTLSCRSANQIILYEMLKQYENIGKFEILVDELREKLGILKNEYPRWDNFKVRILDSCQQGLSENTDIKFTYEKGKSGRGGKWISIIFYISKNDNYVDKLSLSEFIDVQQIKEEEIIMDNKEFLEIESGFVFQDERLEFLASACDYEFNEREMRVIADMLIKKFPSGEDVQMERNDYLIEKYHEFLLQASREEIVNRFAYFKALVKNDLDNM